RVCSPLQNILEKAHGALISRLAKGVHGLLANFGVAAGFSDLDQQRDAFAVRHLLERGDGAALHVALGIAIYGLPDRTHRLRAGLPGQPDERLSAHTATAAVAG